MGKGQRVQTDRNGVFGPPSRWLGNRLLVVMVALAVLLLLLVLFVADNFVLIEVRLVVTRIQMRLAWALIIAFLLGILAGIAISRLRP